MPRAVILTALSVAYLAVRTHLSELREDTHPSGTIYDRGNFSAERLEGIDKIWCSTGLAWFYESLSLWVAAERCCERSLTIRKEQLGDRHPDTATSLNNLAAL